MAFGVKVKLDVEVIGGGKLRSQIQQAVENATQGKPIKIRHLSIDLGRQEAQRISKQLESAFASQDISIKIAKIDASKPVAELKKQLTTMLSGLSITGLKDFLGADGVADSYERATAAANKLAEAQDNVRKKTEEANVALKTLKSVQSTLNTVFKSSTGVGDQSKLDVYLSTYRELLAASESAKNMQGDAQAAEVMRITAATIALKQQVNAQLEAEQAAKRKANATKSAEEIARQAAVAQERAAKKEANISRQAVQLRQRINTWIQNNSKAYAANKTEIDSLLVSLQNEAAVSDVVLAQLRLRFEEINASARESGIAGRSFFDTLKAGWAKFGGWSLVTKSMMAAVNTIKTMVNTVIELDSAMTELRKVTDLTGQEYSQFADKATAIAKRIGASVADTINATADFARLGYNVDEAALLAEAALVYKNVGDGIDDISVSTESLISTIKAFGIETTGAMHIVDMFNEVGNNFAISSSGIGDALQRSASALAAAGNTIEQSIGLVTAMNSVVQNPEAVGTALKALTMYLRAAKTEAEEAGIETDGMASSVSELRNELKSLTGIDIMIDDDTFKSTYQIIDEISNVWSSLTDVTRSNVLNLLGGKRNANVLASLITNFEDAEDAMNSAMDSLGSATTENEKYLDSINGKIVVLKASLEELSANFIDDNLIKGIVDALKAGVDGVNWLVETFGALPVVIGVATAALNLFGKSFGIFSAINGKMTIFGQSWNDIGGTISSVQGCFKSLHMFISTFFSKLTNDNKALVAFNNALQNGTSFQDAFTNHMQNASAGAQDMARAIGNGNATLGTFGISAAAVTAKTALLTVGTKLLAAAMNSLINLGISAAISGIISLFTRWDEKQREAEENAMAAAKAAGETTDAVIDSIESYVELAISLREGKISEDEFAKSAQNIISTLTSQGETIDELIEKYGSLNDAMLNASQASLKEAEAGLRVALTNAEKALKSAYDDWFDNDITIFNAMNGVSKTEKAIKDLLQSRGYNVNISAMSSRGYTAETGASLILEDAHTIEGVIAQYNELYDILQLLSTVDGADKTNFYQGVYEEYTRLKGLVDGYNTAIIDLNHNLTAQNFSAVLSDMGVPQSTDEFNAFRDALIQACIDTNGFVSANGDIAHAAEIAVDALILEQGWASKFSDSMIGAGDAANTTSTSLHKFADVLERLQKGYNILAQAEAEMENGDGLSVDTISSMVSMLDEGEKITDYLTYENGLIKLNEMAWKERAESMLNEDISSIKQQIAALEAENAALSHTREEALANSKEIEQNEESIAALAKELGLLQATYDKVVNGSDDPMNLSTMISDLESVGGKVKGLLSVLKDLEGGTALSSGEIASLALQYEELFGMAPEYDLTTLEGQEAAIRAVIAAYEAECDAIIDTQIAELEAAKTREGITEAEISAIDAIIARLTSFKSLSVDDIFGEDVTDKPKEYSDWANAIKEMADAANLLESIKSSGADDYFATLQKVLDFLGDHPDMSITDFINQDGSFVDVDSNLMDKVFESFLAQLKELDSYDAHWDDALRAAFNNVVSGEVAVIDSTERVSKALSALTKVQEFEVAIDSGETNLIDQMNQAMEMAEAINEINKDLQNGADTVDWTDWIGSFDANAGVIEWNTNAIRELINAQIDAAFAGTEIEKTQPGIIAKLKETAVAVEETASAYDALSNALSAAGDASSLLTDIRTKSTDVLGMIEQAAKMAEDSGLALNRFFSTTPEGVAWKEDWQNDYIDSYIEKLNTANGTSQKFSQSEIDVIKKFAATQMEAAASSEVLSNAISGIETASSLLTDIQSGDGNVLDMLSTISDMASQSGQAMSDFYNFMDGSYVWNTQAIKDWAYAQINDLAEINDLTEQETSSLKNMVAAEIEAATMAEKLSNAYSNAHSAIENVASVDGRTEIDYDAYKQMIETDERYASVVDYQNGVLTINAEKYREVTEAVVADTRALAEQAMSASMVEKGQLELIAQSRDLTDAEQQRLDSLNAEINGYRVLISELDNVYSAYNRYNAASASGDSGRYSTLQEMLQTIKDVTQNKDSDIYGMIGDERFKIAYELLISPEIEIDSPEFKAQLKAVERYITDGKEGMDNFVADLTANGFVSDDGVINTSLQDIADALNIDVDFLRGLFEQLNLYLEDPIQIESPDFELSGVEAAIKKADEYLNTGAEGVQKFYHDLVGAGLFDETTQQITGTSEQIAQELGVSTEVARQGVDKLKNSMDGISQVGDEVISQMTFEEAVSKLQEITTEVEKLDAAKISFEYDEKNITTAMDTLTDLSTMADSLNEINVSLQVDGEDGSTIEDVSSKLEKLKQLQLTLDVNSALASLQSVVSAGNLIVDMIHRVGANPMSINVSRAISSLQRVVSNVQSVINRINAIPASKTTTVYVRQVSSGFGRGGTAFASGNANAESSAKIPGGSTLTGEQGRELVVDPHTNQWYTVGDYGAEFVNLPKDAIVFNARQTRELLETGHTDTRGFSMASGNAAASLLSSLKNVGNKLLNAVKKTPVGKAVSSIISKDKGKGIYVGSIKSLANGVGSTSDKVSGNVNSYKGSSSSKKSGSGGRGGGGGGSSGGVGSSKKTGLEKLKEQYEELNKQTEHLIAHQEFLYKQAEKGLDYSGMDKSLQAQAELYKKIMADSQAAVADMIANGADDTNEELQSMEEAYWSAYDSLYETLDKINELYVNALNEKIDGIQEAFDNLKTAADEFTKYGGITMDSFQALLENGVQYMSLLENENGQYVINTEGIQKMIAAQKEQLAVESAISYLKQLQTALADGESNAVANLVNLTNQLSSSTWDAVYAQAALLRENLSDEQYAKVIANIDALRAISLSVITDISKELKDADDLRKKNSEDQLGALDEILSLTEDLIKAEAEDRIDAIEDEIDAYKKIIDLKKESLKASKDENDYAKSVAEKTKEIAKLQARIDQLKLDDSREARAERASLEEQLSDLQSDLGDLQGDHAYDIQTEALDKAADDFEEARQQEIDAIESSISSAEKLYQAALVRLESGWNTLYQELIDWNTEAGSSLNSEITENWLKAAEAVKLYGSYTKAVAGLKQEQESIESSSNSHTDGNVVAIGTPTVIPPKAEETPPNPPEPQAKPEPAPEPEPTKQVVVGNGRWNVRVGPGTSKKILGVVREGTVLEYRGETSGTWYAVRYKDQDAWISSKGTKLVDALPKYHTGGVAGNGDSLKDNEVLSVLEQGEMVLTDKMKKAAYRLIDFKDYLEKKLGNTIGTVSAPLPQLPALAGVGTLGNGGVDIGQMNFSPTIQVEINHSGAMTDKDARQFGKTIADTAMNELYEGFRQRGIGKIFGTKPTQ